MKENMCKMRIRTEAKSHLAAYNQFRLHRDVSGHVFHFNFHCEVRRVFERDRHKVIWGQNISDRLSEVKIVLYSNERFKRVFNATQQNQRLVLSKSNE